MRTSKRVYEVLLYYVYTPIRSPEQCRREQHLLCVANRLRGRVLISHEGVNGTLSGLQEDTQRYVRCLRREARFRDVDVKMETHHAHAFNKLNVRVKPEIVRLNMPHLSPRQRTGQYLSPREFETLLRSKSEQVLVLDVRSDYEHALGKFKNARTLDIRHFRELPKKLDELSQYKDKKIITYCTGGVRCEKATAYLLSKGFKDVCQLKGGILRYAQETDGTLFEGTCYVFDQRLHTSVDKRSSRKKIGRCVVCREVSEHLINCANPLCNKHVIVCQSCADTLEGACSESCRKHPQKRAYNGTGYYTRMTRGYNPLALNR